MDWDEEATREKDGDDGQPETNHAKALIILDACRREDIDDLKSLAVSPGGFLSDAIRRQACESDRSPRIMLSYTGYS